MRCFQKQRLEINVNRKTQNWLGLEERDNGLNLPGRYKRSSPLECEEGWNN